MSEPLKRVKRIKNIHARKSAVPDEFHPRLLRVISSGVDESLALIFNKSIEEAKLPPEWKRGNISLFFQKG